LADLAKCKEKGNYKGDHQGAIGLRLLLVFLAIVWAVSANAEQSRWIPDRLYWPLASAHPGINSAPFGLSRWNARNFGAIFSWENRALGLDYQVGGFQNSFYEFSAHFSVAKSWDLRNDLSFKAFLSLADYRANSRFFPVRLGGTDYVFIPGLQVNFRRTFLTYQPSPQPGNPAAAVQAVGLHFPLGKSQ